MKLDPWVRLFLGLVITLSWQLIKEFTHMILSTIFWLIRQFLLMDASPNTIRGTWNGLDVFKTVFWPAVAWLGANAALFGPYAPIVTAIVALAIAIRTYLQEDDGWVPRIGD